MGSEHTHTASEDLACPHGHHTFIEGDRVPMLTCSLPQRVPVLWRLGIYRHVHGWSALLSRLSVDSEPVEAGVLRVAPVGQDPELYYLEGLVRPFLKLRE